MEDTKFQKVENFKYLGLLVTVDNIIAEEIKEKISAGNRCYFSIQEIFNCTKISRATKIRLYKVVLKSVVTYESETWTVTVTEEEWLCRWEIKVLRRIFGAVTLQGTWRIRMNAEIQQIYGEPDIVTDIKKSRIRWAGHVQRMLETSTLKKFFIGRPGGRRRPENNDWMIFRSTCTGSVQKDGD